MPALRRGLRLPQEKDLVRGEMIRMLSVTLTAVPSLEPELATLLNPNDLEVRNAANGSNTEGPHPFSQCLIIVVVILKKKNPGAGARHATEPQRPRGE